MHDLGSLVWSGPFSSPVLRRLHPGRISGLCGPESGLMGHGRGRPVGAGRSVGVMGGGWPGRAGWTWRSDRVNGSDVGTIWFDTMWKGISGRYLDLAVVTSDNQESPVVWLDAGARGSG
jgi:hypothetical protein